MSLCRRVLLGSVFAFTVAGATIGSATAKDLTILTSVPGLNFPFFVHMLKAMKAEVTAQGATPLEADGQNNAPKQTADVEAGLTKGVDGIVMSPIDVNAMAPALNEIADAGVPVVTIDRRVPTAKNVLAHVGADNVKGGEAQGQWVLDTFPNGATIVNLQGQPGASPAIDRNKGLHNVLDAHKDKYKFAAEQTANFARDQGLSVTEALLSSLPTQPDVIVSANDDMALGAFEALKGRNLQGKVKVIGFDALPDALASIRDGGMAGTVEQFPAEQSKTAVDILMRYIKEKKKPDSDLVLLTPIVLTKQNLSKAERLDEVK
ncbi:substrate-binding domain-containing protein [Lichenifustis flavocetrariae]|uniref:Substrate-binding domain-containing protein n=1 Tax=Lichenifustis flavocetrariae TaxID=2949735 RepID=A0AA42CJK9_9HYPH|nr:substrate-binding domain-containing protein [Lichenifustis flavocetrariae]MCW6508191.1 substrate-binding domain-containing protein [Lichenifustis flavocetrariae]